MSGANLEHSPTIHEAQSDGKRRSRRSRGHAARGWRRVLTGVGLALLALVAAALAALALLQSRQPIDGAGTTPVVKPGIVATPVVPESETELSREGPAAPEDPEG